EIEGVNVFPSAIASVNKKDTAILSRILHERSVLDVLPADIAFYYGQLTNENQQHNLPDELHLYAIKTRGEPAILQNRDIARAEAGTMEIYIKFDNNGTAKLAALTRENIQRYLAIILDDEVVMTPRIYHSITNGRMSLQGNFSLGEAVELADRLTTNYL